MSALFVGISRQELGDIMQMHKNALTLAVLAAVSANAFGGSAADTAAKAIKNFEPPHAKAHFKYPIRSQSAGGAILYDQSGDVGLGILSQNYEPPNDDLDSEGADDFVVTDAAGWTISGFNFQMTFDSDPTPVTYNINVYSDSGMGFPAASTACSYTSIPGTLDPLFTDLSVSLPAPCVLQQGTYWVSVVANIDFSVGAAMWAIDLDPGLGAHAVWRNPLDGTGVGCTTWSDITTCGLGNPAWLPLFQVVGAVGTSQGCGPGEICLVSTVSTTPGTCGATDTIDASVGDQVDFCYTVTNNTSIALDYHTLQNNIEGTIFSLFNQSLAPGDSMRFDNIKTVSQSNTYNATWTARDVPPGYVAEVESGGNCSDRIFADGFNGPTAPCAGNFVDITSTGTALGLGDDEAIGVTMPFSFNFYGTTSNQLCVDNNGFVAFDTANCSTFDFSFWGNGSLPATSMPAPAIMPLWDDFTSGFGDVYTDVRGSAPNRQFIVEWFDHHHFGPGNLDSATFELVLSEDGTIRFEYLDVDYTGIDGGESEDCNGGLCATIGLQGGPALFNQFSALEASVTSNSGIKWTASSSQAFTSSDTATVNVGAPDIDVQPPTLAGTVPEGGSSSIPFDIANLGDRDLHWSLDEAGPSNVHFSLPGTRFVMPMGDPTESTTARPQMAFPHPRKPGQRAGHGNHIVLAPGVTAFAADTYFDEFYTFDVTANNGNSPVGGAQGTAFGFKFLDGDFSQAYGIDKFGGQINTFATVSATDGTITPIGMSNPSADTDGFTGFAQDPTTGTLYASGTTCNSSSHLYTIDRNTGASTLVGELTGMPCAIWIAIGPDGLMYAVDIVNDALYAVDKTSGATSLKGSVGFNANFAQDADFDQSTGVLYWAASNAGNGSGEIRTIDLNTGDTTLVYSLGFTGIVGLATETFGGPCAQPQDLPWLSLNPPSGTTAPGVSTGVIASIDGTGAVAGDILSGTVCVNSNDPDEHRVEVPIEFTVVAVPPPPTPTVTKAFVPSAVDAATPSTLTITLANAGAAPANLTAPLTDAFPAGLVVAAAPNASTTCGGTVTAVAGTDSVTLDAVGSAIPAADSCTITVDVESTVSDIYANTIVAGSLQTDAGDSAADAQATLEVTP